MFDLKDYQEYDYQDEYRLSINARQRERYQNNYITRTGVPIKDAYKNRARDYNLSSFTCEHCGKTMKSGSKHRHLFPHKNYNKISNILLPATCRKLKYDLQIPEGKFQCGCGSILRDLVGDKNVHFKTKKHSKWLNDTFQNE